MDAIGKVQIDNYFAALSAQKLSYELPTSGSTIRDTQDRSSALYPTAVSASTASAASRIWIDTSSISIDRSKRLPVLSHAPIAIVALGSKGVTTYSSTSRNIISNPPYNTITILPPSEPDLAPYWIRSDVPRPASFDEIWASSSNAYDELGWARKVVNALDEREDHWLKQVQSSTVLAILDAAYPSNEPDAVNNGNHWRSEAAVSRHMDSSRSKNRISQIMASIHTNALEVFERSGTH